MINNKKEQNKIKQYLKSTPYSNIKKYFLDNVNYERCFQELIDFLDDENQKILNKFMIKILSNPNDFTLKELKEELYTI